MHRQIKIALLNSLFLLSASSFAAGVSSLPKILNNDITREQQLRIEQQRQTIEQQQEQKSHRLGSPQQQPKPEAEQSQVCFDINQITLHNASQLSTEQQQQLVQPYQQQCLGINQLEQLQQAITQWYYEQGFVTTRVYFPQQDLSDGHLTLTIQEGFIESMAFTQNDTNQRLSLEQAMPATAGQLLNLRDIEQGLEQLNRLQSNQAQVQFIPGTQAGSTQIQVDNSPQKIWRLSVAYNNSGQQETGKQQRSFFADIDSPFKHNGYAYFSYQGDVKDDQRDGKGSENIALHYDIPKGYWNFSFDASWSEYLTTVKGQLTHFRFTGKSNQQRLGLSRILFRDNNSKWRLAGNLIRKDNKNFIEGELIDINSRTLSLVELALSYWWYGQNNASLNGTLAYQQGLKWFNAPDDSQLAAHQLPKAQFNKTTLSINFLQPFQWGEQTFRWQSNFQGQYTDDLLFGTERISITGQYSVRAYSETSLSGDRGAYWRNELNTFLPAHWFKTAKGNLQLKAGIDMGKVNFQGLEHTHWQSLSGWFIGASWYSPHLNMSLTYARPIHAPKEWPADESSTWFNISINI